MATFHHTGRCLPSLGRASYVHSIAETPGAPKLMTTQVVVGNGTVRSVLLGGQ